MYPNVDDYPYQPARNSDSAYYFNQDNGHTTYRSKTNSDDVPPPLPPQNRRTLTANIIDDMDAPNVRMSTSSSHWDQDNIFEEAPFNVYENN